MRGLIFVSDERLRYAAENLSRMGMEIRTVSRSGEFTEELRAYGETCRMVILPIRGTADGTVELDGKRLELGSFLEHLGQEVLLISGLRTDYEESLGCRYFCFQEDEGFAAENARLTAEGILYLLLVNTPGSLYEYTYDVIGGGRCGKAALKLLGRLGLPCRLISGSKREGSVSLEQWRESEPGDVIINTAPAMVIDQKTALAWKKPVIIIDISSRGAGTEACVSELEGVSCYIAPPLPGIIAPKTGGRLLAELAAGLLEKGR